MEIAIADTGFVVALLNRSDPQHRSVTAIYLQRQPIDYSAPDRTG